MTIKTASVFMPEQTTNSSVRGGADADRGSQCGHDGTDRNTSEAPLMSIWPVRPAAKSIDKVFFCFPSKVLASCLLKQIFNLFVELIMRVICASLFIFVFIIS
jgi:hypothetical protein